MENITFYKISCKDVSISDVYIGSTNDFKNRISRHKSNCNNENSSKHNYKVYSYIRDNGGWSNWDMNEIERLMCDKKERDERERHWIEYYNAKLNICIPGRDRIEYRKLYREQHKDKISERKKLYREQHKDEISEYMKLYYEEHKDKINEKQKLYYEKQKSERNKKIECECGAIVAKQHLTKHRKTKKHKKWMDQLNNI
jgi:hypothetical protein